jgi:hypothetical protein
VAAEPQSAKVTEAMLHGGPPPDLASAGPAITDIGVTDSRRPGTSVFPMMATETGSRLDNPRMPQTLASVGPAITGAGVTDTRQPGTAPVVPIQTETGARLNAAQQPPAPAANPREQLTADLRRAVGGQPIAPGPFSLSDPATIRAARTRFAESGRIGDWNAGVTEFLADRFQRAMDATDTAHDFHRQIFANPRDRAILTATMPQDQRTALRDLMRVTDLAQRAP